jgi:hypothetical protein
MIRFRGVLAANAPLRSEVVPKKEPRKLAEHSAVERADAEQAHLLGDEPVKPKRPVSALPKARFSVIWFLAARGLPKHDCTEGDGVSLFICPFASWLQGTSI